MGITDGLGGLADKAKGLMSDEQVDQVAEKVKEKAPDQVDGGVEALAEQAKKVND